MYNPYLSGYHHPYLGVTHPNVAETLRRSRELLGASVLAPVTNVPVSLATTTALRRS
jgi:hypothetical protein